MKHVALLLALTGFVHAPLLHAQTAMPDPMLLRAEEDYRFLANDSLRRALAGAGLKFIPLSRSGQQFLSLGFDARYQYEFYDAEDWGLTPDDRDGFLLQRFHLHMGLHLSQRIRVFGTLKSTLVYGRDNNAPRPTDTDTLDVHQLFAEYAAPFGAGTIQVRLGRQELFFGSQRLISLREGPNTRQTFDVARVIVRQPRSRLDVFAANAVNSFPRVFDDWWQTNRLGGIYYTRNALPRIHNLDLYLLWSQRDRRRFEAGASRDERAVIGGRIFQTTGNFMYDIELTGQMGQSGLSGDILAGSAAIWLRYRWREHPLWPQVGFKSNLFSGDGNPSDDRLATFDPLYPRGAYFGLAALLGPSNLMDLHPSIAIHPWKGRMQASLDWDFFWRHRTSDGLYGPVGNYNLAGDLNRQRYIGHQLGWDADYQINRSWSVGVEGTYFWRGDYLQQVAATRNLLHLVATVQFQL